MFSVILNSFSHRRHQPEPSQRCTAPNAATTPKTHFKLSKIQLSFSFLLSNKGAAT